jgi:hypothetical protein
MENQLRKGDLLGLLISLHKKVHSVLQNGTFFYKDEIYFLLPDASVPFSIV